MVTVVSQIRGVRGIPQGLWGGGEGRWRSEMEGIRSLCYVGGVGGTRPDIYLGQSVQLALIDTHTNKPAHTHMDRIKNK